MAVKAATRGYVTIAAPLVMPEAKIGATMRKVFTVLLKQHVANGGECNHTFQPHEIKQTEGAGKQCATHGPDGGRKLKGTLEATFRSLNACTGCGARVTFKYSFGLYLNRGVMARAPSRPPAAHACPASSRFRRRNREEDL